MTSRIEEVAKLAMQMYQESPYTLPVHLEDFIETLSSGVEIFVEYSDDKAVGFVIAVLGHKHPIWGNTTYAAELAWYVLPEFRNRGIALKLKERFESWARLNGAKLVIMAAMHNDSFDQVKSMYEKSGYTQAEVAFFKELN
jgi:GNAT superfamily N-acetyltransferase